MKMLLEETGDFAVMESFADLATFQERGERKFELLLVNPLVVHPHKSFTVRTVFSGCDQAAVVAIVGGYVDAGALAGFDGAISIYDDTAVVRRKLERIVRMQANRPERDARNIDLSQREKEILISVANGLTNKEIADKHFISVHTVVSHRKNITRKTGIKTVSGLTIYAVLNNLIP
jgi:DNA-binding CsgD family transcriptional regulator